VIWLPTLFPRWLTHPSEIPFDPEPVLTLGSVTFLLFGPPAGLCPFVISLTPLC
jgi:hypothetical protein